MLATAFCGYILYAIYGPFKSSYNQDLDTIKCYYLIPFAAVMALLFHSNLNRTIVADYGWAFTQYLETVAILGQFVLFTRKVHISITKGWLDLDLYIAFRSFTSNITYFINNILDIHIHRT